MKYLIYYKYDQTHVLNNLMFLTKLSSTVVFKRTFTDLMVSEKCVYFTEPEFLSPDAFKARHYF